MRVLISGALPPPLGGVGVYYETLLNSSLPEKVDLFFVQTSSQKRDLSKAGVFSGKNIIAAIVDCVKFSISVLKNRPQIIHIGTAFGLSFIKHSLCVIIGRIFRCKVLLHPHCSYQVLYQNRSKIWKLYFKTVIKITNGIIVLSKEWMDLIEILPKRKIFFLPNAIDTKTYNIDNHHLLREYQNKKEFKILYLGYVGKAKGSLDLIDAADDLMFKKKKYFFDMVGGELSPNEKQIIQERIKKLSLESYVKIYDPVIGKEKLNYFYDADIFLYPSYHEGMPLAIIEAMACGLPIIATNVGGIPDLIEDGLNGKLIQPGQPSQIVNAILEVSNDVSLLQSMGNNSFRIAREKYDIENHVTKLIEIYNLFC